MASADRVGPIVIGAARGAVENALGAPLVAAGTADACAYGRPAGRRGVMVMLMAGTVARVDITQPGLATDAGIQVGDDEARIRAAYGSRAVASPHKYTDGRVFTVAADGTHHVVFETDGRLITRYRVGRLPEVDWVEGCS